LEANEEPLLESLREGLFFLICIKYGRISELIPNPSKVSCVDSKDGYKLFSFLPLDKISTGHRARTERRGKREWRIGIGAVPR
jgi:hypothetical protein